MKIVCSNCESRYSISDEKIRGRNKVFKIKCKNCGHVLSIRGTDDPEGEASGSGAEEWYIAVGGERIGPLPLSVVEERIKSGDVTDQTFVWRQGFPDWKRSHDVPEIAALFAPAVEHEEHELGFSGIFATEEYESAKAASAAAVAEADDEAEAPEGEDTADEEAEEQVAEPEASEPEADETAAAVTFEEPAAETGAEPATDESEAAKAGPDEGLFAAFDTQAPEEEDDEIVDTGVVSSTGEVDVASVVGGGGPGAGAPGEGVQDDSGMVWQRHESSVLFSLDDYRGDDSARAPAKEVEEVTDSGLIDIRAIARKESRAGAGAGDVFAEFSADERRTPDTIMPLDASAMPILRRRSKTPLIAGIAAVVVIAAGVAAYFLFFADKTPAPGPAPGPVAEVPATTTQGAGEGKTVETAGTATAPAPGPDAGSSAAVAAGAPDAGSTGAVAASADVAAGGVAAAAGDDTKGGPVELASADGAGEAEKKDEPEKREVRTTPRRPKREDKKDEPKEEKPAPKREVKPQPKKEEKEQPKSADALLQQLQAQKKKTPEPKAEDKPKTAEADSSLPAKLSASKVRGVVKGYEGRVKACAGSGETDTFVRTNITILNSGKVGGARVTSGATGSVASCVVGVLKSMSFPKFQQPSMTVNIPFKVR